jgi:cytochrome c peroxidase
MKAFTVILFLIFTIFCLSFSKKGNKSYNNLYERSLHEFKRQQTVLESFILNTDLSSEENKKSLREQIEAARLKLKNIDFWLRYFEPNAYRRINGPLPVEWENEVFEKFEPPYRREGAGLSLAELSLDQTPLLKDSLIQLIKRSEEAIKTFEADSITGQLNSYSHFFLANRLFLLNLAAIYTTGFECPDTNHVIPELRSMLLGTKEIYNSYNQSFYENPLPGEYLEKYEKTISFVEMQGNGFSSFNHFDFLRDFVNPLFAMNQKLIDDYNARSINYNDYTLNNNAKSIFDKSLYVSQNTKGLYSMVEDEKTLQEIRYIGKLLFYDPILSGNNMRSCASCHKPTEYFTDTTNGQAFQFDKQQRLPRNTPTLINSV